MSFDCAGLSSRVPPARHVPKQRINITSDSHRACSPPNLSSANAARISDPFRDSERYFAPASRAAPADRRESQHARSNPRAFRCLASTQPSAANFPFPPRMVAALGQCWRTTSRRPQSRLSYCSIFIRPPSLQAGNDVRFVGWKAGLPAHFGGTVNLSMGLFRPVKAAQPPLDSDDLSRNILVFLLRRKMPAADILRPSGGRPIVHGRRESCGLFQRHSFS